MGGAIARPRIPIIKGYIGIQQRIMRGITRTRIPIIKECMHTTMDCASFAF